MDTTPATTPAKVEEKEAIQYAFSMESKRWIWMQKVIAP